MEFRTCIKIKKKGFNYYSDYIKGYYERVFSEYGFHYVINPAHSEFSLLMFFDDSPWMCVASKKLDELEAAQLQKLASDISAAFKTITSIEPFHPQIWRSTEEYRFSSQHNAFEEPAFIQSGDTVLGWHCVDCFCLSGIPFSLSCLNYGGITKGLELLISGDFVEKDTVAFDSLEIHSYDYHRKKNNLLTYEAERQKRKLGDGSSVYYYDFADFEFPEGINPYSAKLRFGSGDNQRDARSLHLRTIPIGRQDELDTMRVSIIPKCNQAGGVQWHRWLTT